VNCNSFCLVYFLNAAPGNVGPRYVPALPVSTAGSAWERRFIYMGSEMMYIGVDDRSVTSVPNYRRVCEATP
jgi:hypothetical protein